MCIPLLLSALEGSVTNTALPTISDQLNLGTKFSWVATAFLLASTTFQPLYGQLADIWGRKYPMMLAVVVFGLGSALCGWATNGAMLIAGRIVQGLGTGGIDLFAELILCDLVPLRKRGTYMAIKHVVFAAGTTVGPLLGGVFAEHGWRWCFWINIPVCGIAVILMFFCLKVGGGVKTKDVKFKDLLARMDGFGTSLLTSSVVLILVSLSMGGSSHPWTSAVVTTPLAVGIVGLIIFPFFEASSYCKAPIMPPQIFSNRTSATAFILTAIHGFVTYGIQFYLPPFFQAVKGSSPTKSGIEVLPTTLVIVLGFAAMALGLGLCTMLTKDTPTGVWVTFQLLLAAGSGIIVSTLLPAVVAPLPDSANGAAAGSWAFLRGTGSLFGVAIPGTIFNIRFSSLLPTINNATAREQLKNGQAYQRASSTFVSKFGPNVKVQIVAAFQDSLKWVWVVFSIFAGVGFLASFVEKQVKLRKELDTQYGLKTPKTTPKVERTLEEIEMDMEKAMEEVEVREPEVAHTA
ncbi:MFS general substrate transporter [Amniculicola lignicola CBS 123094]|uniref:MFS general substrate transporter n=1 Tax=Amniculicola lignicola CBS 123094 TaxID=1392246 RepID=A0A6A5W841_9PLEO|nr:MFS general substrate transporter [Amniculicola lignicola CBS 123094]